MPPTAATAQPREGIPEKAHRYLAEGRVLILQAGPDPLARSPRLTAHVDGGGAVPYIVTVDRGRWSCTCPARVRCCHIVAVSLVVGKALAVDAQPRRSVVSDPGRPDRPVARKNPASQPASERGAKGNNDDDPRT